MRIRNSLILSAVLVLPLAISAAQPKPAAPAHLAAVQPDAVPALTDKDVAATQRQLIDLLKLSPTLTTVVSHDPSLLADTDYVSRNNPQHAAFLAAHPEVARNPQFYLFSHLHPGDNSPDEALEQAVWPEMYRYNGRESRSGFDELLSDLAPVLGVGVFLGAIVWAIRLILDNRRWSRIFKMQSEVHGRLIDKFSSSQELAAYMETEAGKRFLEAAPIPLRTEAPPRIPNALARILTPIQIGMVLTLLGIGFFLLRHAATSNQERFELNMLVLSVLTLMPGIGLLISAGVTWVLATRLGLMPQREEKQLPPSST